MEHRLSGVLNKILSFDKANMPRIASKDNIVDGVMVDFNTSFYEDMSPEQYHADRTRMSSTAIRKLLHSPRQFLTFWQGLDTEEEEPDHFRIGRAAHMFLLEPSKFRDSYIIQPDFGAMQSSKNRAARDAWRADLPPQTIVVTENELTMLIGMIESVLEHPIASKMLENGKPECTIHWTDEETGVMCKARPDYIVKDGGDNLHLIDFKTTRDIRAGIFSYDVMRLGYNVQLAFYHDGLVRSFQRQPQTITIIPVEKKEPHETAVYPLSDKFFEDGQEDYKHALRLYRKCMDTGKWPAYSNTAAVLEAPNTINFKIRPEFNFEEG